MSEKNPVNTSIIQKMEKEISSVLGNSVWDAITSGLNFNPDMCEKELSQCMYIILNRIEEYSDAPQVKEILFNVRHGLDRSDFESEIKEFSKYNNIDLFAKHIQDNYFNQLKDCLNQKQLFSGQEIDQEVYDFLTGIEESFSGKREGNTIYITAIPFRTKEYLHAQNNTMKRYYFCHCQFARESILTDKVVSGVLCNCSLGFSTELWDSVLDTKLSGEVLESVLAGGMRCRYAIKLPDDILKKYT